jgi:hypothetical protein
MQMSLFNLCSVSKPVLHLYSTGLTFQGVSINLKHIFVLEEEENEKVLL